MIMTRQTIKYFYHSLILKVVQTAKEPQTLDAMDGLAGALARALAERSKAINPDSSSSDDEDEEVCEDDEWE